MNQSKPTQLAKQPRSVAGTVDRSYARLRTAQRGFTMVELMVAMAISLIVLAGVVQIFVNNNRTHRSQEANSRVQENGRTAIELLQRDIRPVGFQGCRSARATTPNTVANAPIPTFDSSNLVRGYEATSSSAWSPSLPTAVASAVSGGTDVITVQGPGACADVSNRSMTSNSDFIAFDKENNCDMQAGELVMIADCSSADIFRISSVGNITSGFPPTVIQKKLLHASTSNSSADLSKAYLADSEIVALKSYTYYIDDGTDGSRSLWRYDNTIAASASNPQEVVSGVEDLQIEYGEDTSGSQVPNYYVPADDVSDWSRVISLRISVLVQSASDNITEQPQSYTYNRNTVTATDNRLRRVFTTTIQLRNQVS